MGEAGAKKWAVLDRCWGLASQMWTYFLEMLMKTALNIKIEHNLDKQKSQISIENA